MGSAATAWFLIRRYVERAELTATTCSQVVNRPVPCQEPILVATLISASWQASSASGGVRQHPAADVERARPDGREQLLERVPVAVLRAARELVDLVRRRTRITAHAHVPPDEPEDNAAVSMPHRLGRYAVRRRIGTGGFATVWLAYDEQLDSPVAIKVLADNWTEDHHVRQRFLEEGRYLRKVESPNVVTVYDAGELEDGRPYLVMSYADQGTLADRLEIEGLTVAQAMEVVRQVGAGLQALHERDIVHRDVKPANVLFRSVRGSSGDAAAAGDGRRPRARQGARHVVPAHDGRRDAVLRRARAGAAPRVRTPGPTSTPWPRWPSCCSPADRRTATPTWPRPPSPGALPPVSTAGTAVPGRRWRPCSAAGWRPTATSRYPT